MEKIKDKNLSEILKWSPAEKLFVVECLWENLRDEALKELPDKEQLNLVRERLEAYKKNPSNVKKWQEVKKNYLKKK